MPRSSFAVSLVITIALSTGSALAQSDPPTALSSAETRPALGTAWAAGSQAWVVLTALSRQPVESLEGVTTTSVGGHRLFAAVAIADPAVAGRYRSAVGAAVTVLGRDGRRCVGRIEAPSYVSVADDPSDVYSDHQTVPSEGVWAVAARVRGCSVSRFETFEGGVLLVAHGSGARLRTWTRAAVPDSVDSPSWGGDPRATPALRERAIATPPAVGGLRAEATRWSSPDGRSLDHRTLSGNTGLRAHSVGALEANGRRYALPADFTVGQVFDLGDSREPVIVATTGGNPTVFRAQPERVAVLARGRSVPVIEQPGCG